MQDTDIGTRRDERRMNGATQPGATIGVGLSAAILAVHGEEPVVLTVPAHGPATTPEALPSGQFKPQKHATLGAGLRDWVAEHTGLELGHIEQLHAFAGGAMGPEAISVGYLALARPDAEARTGASRWRSWYDFLPWEDWREGKPKILSSVIEPCLIEWAASPSAPAGGTTSRADRLRICFGLGTAWDEERAFDRFELLSEAGLIEETYGPSSGAQAGRDRPRVGEAMAKGHRRMLAIAIGRLRTRLKYRPVVFELVDAEFTLFELQKTVEAILGPNLHKQNFRRLVSSTGLVEPTGEIRVKTGGRPAKLYRYRPEVELERPAPGVRIKVGRP